MQQKQHSCSQKYRTIKRKLQNKNYEKSYISVPCRQKGVKNYDTVLCDIKDKQQQTQILTANAE